MKDFIVLLGILPIALVLVLQLGVTAENHYDMVAVSKQVAYYAEEARYDGQFTAEKQEKLKENIADILECEKNEVVITCPADVKYKASHFDNSGKIEYKVKAPIKHIIAGAGLFGISADENKGVVVKEGYVMSEKLP